MSGFGSHAVCSSQVRVTSMFTSALEYRPVYVRRSFVTCIGERQAARTSSIGEIEVHHYFQYWLYMCNQMIFSRHWSNCITLDQTRKCTSWNMVNVRQSGIARLRIARELLQAHTLHYQSLNHVVMRRLRSIFLAILAELSIIMRRIRGIHIV